MKKNYRIIKWRHLITSLLLLIVGATFAQPLTTTFANSNGNSLVTFNFQNTNGYAVQITDISSITSLTGANTGQLWFKPSAIAGAPGAISAANGWTQIFTQSFTGVANTTTSTSQLMLTGVSLIIPAGATYGIAYACTNLRYSTLTAGTYTTSGGGCNLITGTSIGYGGALPPAAPLNTPRGFIGSVNFIASVPCTGTPAPGNTLSSVASACPSINFNLSLQNAIPGSGITYQWQSSPDGITYSNVAGSTSTYSTSQTVATYYQCIVTCAGSASSATSTPVVVNMVSATYATIPYLETFEASWINGCATKDIVSNSWRNNPITGNNSWRRQNEGATAAWSFLPTGLVTPSGSTGAASFHSYGALSGLIGAYDLYVDLSTTSAVSLGFNYQNATGADILEVLLSTDGGVTFGPVLGTYTTGAWAAQTLNLGVVGSATSVIRFKASSDYGDDDIGIDNVVVGLSPSCIAPNALTVIPTAATAATLSWTCLACTGSFIVEYGPEGFTPGTTAAPGVGGTIASISATSPFNLTGLPTTGITDIYVRQDCGSSAYSSNASVAKFIPGDVCENAIDLATLTSPLNGTTTGANDNFTNTCAFGNTSPDLIYSIQVPNLYTLVIGQTVNGYDSENTLFYGGACPGTTQIACYDDPDVQSSTWQNTTGSTQTVYWVQDGYFSAINNGTFTLEWSLTAPASCVAPIDLTVIPTTPTDATVSWNCIACTGSYIVEYGPEGFTPGIATTPGVGGTIASLAAVTPFNLTGLASTTVSDVYVRQDCGSSDYSLNATLAKFIPGDVCENVINLATLTSPYNGTTTGANDNFTNTCAGGNSSSDLVFTIDVPDLYTLVIGQTANGYDSENTLFYGGSCPGTTQIACYDDPDIQSSTWQNTTGSTQTVYWVQDGYFSATNNGTFTLEWTLTAPASCPEPTGLNVTGVSTSGATLNWNCPSCSGTYTIEYGPVGFTPGSGTTVTSSVASVVITGLTIGTNYEFYVTQDCSSSSSGFSTAAGPYAFSTTIAGDAVCDAIALTFGSNGPYDNTTATNEIGEPIPPTGGCGTQTTWCDFSTTPDNSMWFTFVAPASGRVKIQAPGFDTQLALWNATNCAALLTGGATLIAANDDDADYLANGGAMFSSLLDPIICLTPGTTYYVQLDGYSGTVGPTTIILTDLGLVNSTFTGLSSSYCIGASSAALTPATLGGVFSGTGISGSSFDPAIAGVGSYSVTYTLDGCYTSTQSVTVNPLPTVTAASTGSIVCSGTSVTLTGGGATSYAWDNSVVDGVAFASTTTTTYNVTGTDVNGCTNTASTTISVNGIPVVTASSDTAGAICSGTFVSLTGSGATTYVWDNSVVDGVAFASTTTTTYNVTGTDVNGCTNTASVSVSVNALPTVTATSTGSSVCSGTTVTLTGGGATTYVWDNSVIDGTAFSPTGTTTYNVVGTDVNGCSNTASVSVTVNALPTVTATSTSSSVCSGTSVTLTGGGATTYVWDNSVVDGTAFVPSGSLSYNVVGTDANGCTNTASVSITVNTLPTVTAASTGSIVCLGTAVTLTGGGATTYVWDNSVVEGTSFVPTGTTTYNVVGTDVNGCTNTASVSVTVNDLPIVTATSTSSSVCSGTSVTLTGGGATSYAWDNSVIDGTAFVPTGTTSYNVIGTDANGCTNTASISIGVNGIPIVTASSDAVDSICSGTQITLTGGGATTYVWDNSVVDGVAFASTTTTTYNVTGTDVNGCTNTASVTVSVNASPTVTAFVTDSSVCSGTSVTLTGGGATTYVWDNSVVDGSAFIPTGTTTYNVIGTDLNGCSNTTSVSVSVNAIPIVIASADNDTVCSGTMITLTGGGALTYTWDNSVIDGVAFAATDTLTYQVIGTDVNGCSNSSSITVFVYESSTVSLAPFTAPLCLQGSFITLTGGTPIGGIYSGTGVSSGNFNPALAGVGTFPITYTIVGLNGCSNSSVSNITVQDCTGINDNSTSQEVFVYPNPTNGSFSIVINSLIYTELFIKIVDVQGKEIFSSVEKDVRGSYTKQINLEDISKGMYYIILSSGSEIKTQKLIIQ